MPRLSYFSLLLLGAACLSASLSLFFLNQSNIDSSADKLYWRPLPGLTVNAETTGGGNPPETSGGGNPPSTTGGGNPPDNQSYKTLPNPLGPTTMTIGDVPSIIGGVINAVLGILGAIALLVVIYGGFLWMTSAGNESQVAKGRNTLMWAAIALIIIFMSWILVAFLFQALGV